MKKELETPQKQKLSPPQSGLKESSEGEKDPTSEPPRKKTKTNSGETLSPPAPKKALSPERPGVPKSPERVPKSPESPDPQRTVGVVKTDSGADQPNLKKRKLDKQPSSQLLQAATNSDDGVLSSQRKPYAVKRASSGSSLTGNSKTKSPHNRITFVDLVDEDSSETGVKPYGANSSAQTELVAIDGV